MKAIFSTLTIVFFVSLLACNQTNSSSDTNVQSDTIAKMVVSDSATWSVKMAETLMHDFPEIWRMEEAEKPKWNYTFGLVAHAYLKLWQKDGDKRYFDYAKAYIDTMIDSNGSIVGYKKDGYNIDLVNPGKALFILLKETGDQRYKIAMDTLREQIKTQPRTKAGGFWHKQRYPNQMWLDGLYMGAPFYAQFGSEYNEPANFDDVANWFIIMEKKARDTKTGLLYHGWDESKQQKWADKKTGLSPHFWGRAMGWYAMALVDALDYFPENHPKRAAIIAILNRTVEAIVKVQDPETGCWYQVLDQGTREGNYLEGSATAMFAYTLLKAVRLQYIDAKYSDTAIKSFDGLCNHLMQKQPDGRIVVTPVCAVAGLGGDPYRDGTYEYYVNEKKRDNDPKAVGPFIMADLEYQELMRK